MPEFFCKMSVFLFAKNQYFLAKIVPLLKAIIWELCWRFFSSAFCKINTYFKWKCKYYRPYIWNPSSDCSKLLIICKNDNDVTICWYGVIIKIFWRWHVPLVRFSYWSKFHVNIRTGSGVMTIFIYKRLTWNAEIRNTPICVLLDIFRLGQIKITKFGTNICNKKLLIAAKPQGYSFYCFWVIKGKPTGRCKNTFPHRD